MDNVITITLKEDQQKKIEFESRPTIYELTAVKLIIEECLEHNFSKFEILEVQSNLYQRLENVEEVYK